MFKYTLFFTLLSVITLTSVKLYSTSQTSHVPLFVKVKSHFNPDGTGEEDSGYHALKNALLLCKLIVATQSERHSVYSQLTDNTLIKKLFGEKTSLWKAHIIEKRKQQFAIDFVKDTLLTALAGTSIVTKAPKHTTKLKLSCTDQWVSLETLDNKQDRAVLISFLPMLAYQLVTATQTIKDKYCHYQFTFEVIASTLKQLIEKRLVHNPEHIDAISYKNLLDIQHLKSFFPLLQTISFIIEDDNLIISEENDITYKRSYVHRGTSLKEKLEIPGTWLTHEELETLVELECGRTEDPYQTGLISPILKIIPTLYIEGTQINDNFSQQLEYNLKDLVPKLQDPTLSFITILFIHYNTRWFVCVINKSQSSIQYLFADSASHNTAETKEFAAKFLRHLTGKEFSDILQPPVIAASQPETSEKKPAEVTFEKSLVTRNQYAGTLPETVEDIIDILKNRQTYRSMGLTFLPPMMLLYGPPGTGKTTLARLIAYETDRLYTEVVASSLLNKYYGEGVKRLRKIFEDARSLKQPVIIFIDEIDAILGTSTKEKQRTDLLQIFNNELDKKDPNIFVIGATNRYDAIDATTKSRCRNYCLEIPLPDLQGRETIIKHYLAKLGIDDDSFCKTLALNTDKISGRELEIMVNQAIIVAGRSNADKVLENHVHKALEKVKNEIQKEKKEERKKEPSMLDFKSMINHTASSIVSHIALSALIYIADKAYKKVWASSANSATK